MHVCIAFILSDDADFSLSSRVLSFFSQRRECITVTINNDVVFEGEEQIRLVLESTSNIALLPQQTIINIQDNDGMYKDNQIDYFPPLEIKV